MGRTYYIDECISWRVGRAVKVLIEDPFDPGAPNVVVVQGHPQLGGSKDAVLLPIIGDAGAFLITGDKALSGRAERELILRNRVGAFMVAQLGLREEAERILRAWPNIERDAQTLPRPFIRTIRQGGATGAFNKR